VHLVGSYYRDSKGCREVATVLLIKDILVQKAQSWTFTTVSL